MILHGNQRAGANQLAQHLLNSSDNDFVTVHEVRGFVSDNLAEAFNEAFAISRGTKCKQYLYSVSFSPPPSEQVTVEQFEDAIDQVERKMEMEGQPRAIVFHEKNGRRHAHCVWSRIDVQQMKAINLSYPKLRLRTVSQQLFEQNQWHMPNGLRDKEQASPLNYNQEESQQGDRIGRDPRRLKAILQTAWASSDSAGAFENALAAHGFALARGDRRGFVLLNEEEEVLSASRWLGVKPRDLESKLGDPENFLAIDEARQLIRERQHDPLAEEISALKSHYESEIQRLKEESLSLRQSQHEEREALSQYQETRSEAEARHDEKLLRTGLLGIWDRVTGQDKQARQQIERRRQTALQRDRDEEHQLIYQQLGVQQYLQRQKKSLQARVESQLEQLIYEMATRNNEKQEADSAQHFGSKFEPDFDM